MPVRERAVRKTTAPKAWHASCIVAERCLVKTVRGERRYNHPSCVSPMQTLAWLNILSGSSISVKATGTRKQTTGMRFNRSTDSVHRFNFLPTVPRWYTIYSTTNWISGPNISVTNNGKICDLLAGDY